MFQYENMRGKRGLYDPSMKKKYVYIVLTIVVLLWIIGIRNRSSSEYEDEQSLHAALLQTQEQLRISRQQLQTYEKTLRSTCRAHYNIYDGDIPIIYVITPTYTRAVQKAELTRLSHTFMLVPKLHWIVVEDAVNKTELVANLLKESLIDFTHLNAITPSLYKLKTKDPHWKKPRGVQQRNTALEWLRLYHSEDSDKGVVFFADDDNCYSLKIFEEMRWIKKVGVWPVGLVGAMKVEKPLVDNNTGRVIGFNSMWAPERPFPIDMAGFAINLNLVNKKENIKFSFDVDKGYQESSILSKVANVSDLEPLASNCTKVYVWHTRTTDPPLKNEAILKMKGLKPSDFGMEV